MGGPSRRIGSDADGRRIPVGVPPAARGQHRAAVALATTASAAGLVLLALLTIHVQAANTCLAYRLAHLQNRNGQWTEHLRRLECQIAALSTPAALARALDERACLIQMTLESEEDRLRRRGTQAVD
ncbi:MAG: hypothetical protein AB1486_09570 [Planctomycetota bacterium]